MPLPADRHPGAGQLVLRGDRPRARPPRRPARDGGAGRLLPPPRDRRRAGVPEPDPESRRHPRRAAGLGALDARRRPRGAQSDPPRGPAARPAAGRLLPGGDVRGGRPARRRCWRRTTTARSSSSTWRRPAWTRRATRSSRSGRCGWRAGGARRSYSTLVRPSRARRRVRARSTASPTSGSQREGRPPEEAIGRLLTAAEGALLVGPQHRPLRPADAGGAGRPARAELHARPQRRHAGAGPPLRAIGSRTRSKRWPRRCACPTARPTGPAPTSRRPPTCWPGSSSGRGAACGSVGRWSRSAAASSRRWRGSWPAGGRCSPTTRPPALLGLVLDESGQRERVAAEPARRAALDELVRIFEAEDDPAEAPAAALRVGARPGGPGDPGRPAGERRAAGAGPDDPPGEGAGVRRGVRGRLLGRRPAAPPLDGGPARRGGAAPVLRRADPRPPDAGAEPGGLQRRRPSRRRAARSWPSSATRSSRRRGKESFVDVAATGLGGRRGR